LVSEIQGNYRLVIAEKPDAAQRIATALGKASLREMSGIRVFDIPIAFDRNHYIICAVAGHLYGVADPTRIRRVYPVFDTEWLPSELLFSRSKWSDTRRPRKNYSGLAYQMSRRLSVISQLANHAQEIIQACDYDIEGETIGYNIIKYACRNSNAAKHPLRAKFSALTEDELRSSFARLAEMELSLAEAGRARHLVDFLWGINLSRAISEAYRRVGKRFRNLTIGRVQGPTLAFVVDREIEVKAHVPVPYWSLRVMLQKEELEFEAQYEKDRIEEKSEADEVYSHISKERIARVKSAKQNILSEHPPYPFNLGDLQREAYRLYKFSPSMTLSIAERLYLRALISYPRTNSQKLPASLAYSRTIEQLLQQKDYVRYSSLMQDGKRRRFPIQGQKDDPAHPAIYPTGFKININLSSSEKKVYDLIVLRFLATFAEDAVSKLTVLKLLIGGFTFISQGQVLLKAGWRSIYPSHFAVSPLPNLSEGDSVQVNKISLESKFTSAIPAYTQGTLLAKMESENVGTKATRAETISTLIDRGYILQGKTGALSSTETGLALVNALEKGCSQIISTELTRRTDEDLEKIVEEKEIPESILARTFFEVASVLDQIHGSEVEIGSKLQLALDHEHSRPSPTNETSHVKQILIGKCPICETGYLKVVKSFRTHKRFLGCTNYSSGCKASAPLPQRGMIRKFPQQCSRCGWPMISIKFSLRAKGSWNICVNVSCPSKHTREVLRA
jgi:DNA topoisomerase I